MTGLRRWLRGIKEAGCLSITEKQIEERRQEAGRKVDGADGAERITVEAKKRIRGRNQQVKICIGDIPSNPIAAMVQMLSAKSLYIWPDVAKFPISAVECR